MQDESHRSTVPEEDAQRADADIESPRLALIRAVGERIIERCRDLSQRLDEFVKDTRSRRDRSAPPEQ
jgi:hypothetical protein